MFNAYTYEKAITKAEAAEKEGKKHEKALATSSQFRNRLVKDSQQRVVKRIVDMGIRPKPSATKASPTHSTMNYKGEAFFRHKPRDSKERVAHHIEKNRWLDTVPNPKPLFKLRNRDREREINPQLRFTPRDRYQRISDVWCYQESLLESTWKLDKSAAEKFPSVWNKSYYKTLETLAFNLRSSLNTHQLNESQLLDVAKEVLEKCNLRSPRRLRSISIPNTSK